MYPANIMLRMISTIFLKSYHIQICHEDLGRGTNIQVH